ncbi:hypothetical protein ABPG72_021828 [Tetrahymena utriculariae]
MDKINKFSFMILDIFYLGCLNASKFKRSYFQEVLVNYQSIKSIFQLIVNLVLLFGLGLVSEHQIYSYHVFLCYFLVLFQLLRYATLAALYSLEENLSVIVRFVNPSAYVISIFSLIMYQDQFGINLGYYYLIMIGVYFLVVIIVINYKQIYILDEFFFSILTNIQRDTIHLKGKLLLYLSYTCQLIKLVLLLIFGVAKIEKINVDSLYSYEIVRYINLSLTLLLSLPYFYHNFILIIQSVKAIKKFEIKSKENLPALQNYTQKKHKYLQKLNIYVQLDQLEFQNTLTSNQNEQALIQDNQESNKQMIYFQLYKCISDLYKLKKDLEIYIQSDVHQYDQAYILAGEIENLHSSLILYTNNRNKQQIIISKRFENGYLLNESTQYLIQSDNKQIKNIYKQTDYALNRIELFSLLSRHISAKKSRAALIKQKQKFQQDHNKSKTIDNSNSSGDDCINFPSKDQINEIQDFQKQISFSNEKKKEKKKKKKNNQMKKINSKQKSSDVIEMVNLGTQQILSYTDICFVVNKLIELEKLKTIILNEQQIKLFDFIPKPKIDIELVKDLKANTAKKKSKDQSDLQVQENNIDNAKEQEQESALSFGKKRFNILTIQIRTIYEKAKQAQQAFNEIYNNQNQKSEIDLKLIQMLDRSLAQLFQTNTFNDDNLSLLKSQFYNQRQIVSSTFIDQCRQIFQLIKLIQQFKEQNIYFNIKLAQ